MRQAAVVRLLRGMGRTWRRRAFSLPEAGVFTGKSEVATVYNEHGDGGSTVYIDDSGGTLLGLRGKPLPAHVQYYVWRLRKKREQFEDQQRRIGSLRDTQGRVGGDHGEGHSRTPVRRECPRENDDSDRFLTTITDLKCVTIIQFMAPMDRAVRLRTLTTC